MAHEQEQNINHAPTVKDPYEQYYLIARNAKDGSIVTETREQYTTRVKGVAAGTQDGATKQMLEDITAHLTGEKQPEGDWTDTHLAVKEILAAQDELAEIAAAKGYKEDQAQPKGK